MTVIHNEVCKGFYRDSVALLRAARTLSGLPGIEEAGLMIGTAANKEVLRAAGILGDVGARAQPGDLIIAVRARSQEAAAAALAAARRLLEQQGAAPSDVDWHPRTLRGALQQMPDANLAVISLPGEFAAAEARKALRRGLNVMIFSDHVALGDEVALKAEARDRGLLVMGPDCGTAIIAGASLGFANAVPSGDVAIVGASGTGIQEVACLIANAGRGISQAIGTGGRDLSAEVGGISTLTALELLQHDAATGHIVLVSKAAAPEVAARVAARAEESAKPITVCMIGDTGGPAASTWNTCGTLHEAAETVLGRKLAAYQGAMPKANERRRLIRGLYCGGTLCSEAQVVLTRAGCVVASNSPIPGARRLAEGAGGHALLDLGDARFTRGRPHPILEPAQRDAHLCEAWADQAVGVVLLDVILGWGSHPDPAGALVRAIAGKARNGPLVVASVTGTEVDPQVRSAQIRKLRDADVIVAPSNATAAAIALACVG